MGGIIAITKPRDTRIDAIVVIDAVHSKQHASKHYNATFYAVGSPTTTVSLLVTAPPAGNIMHALFSVESDKGIYWTISEAASVGATTSTAIVAYNNDRASVATSGAVFQGNPSTYVSSGTILSSHVTGANGAPSIDPNARNEFILVPATKYLVYVVPTATTTQTIINCSFYLET
jgi:hypothetical protein